MKQNRTSLIQWITLVTLSCSFVQADNGLTAQDKRNLQEITQESAQEIFHTAPTVSDKTIRYTTVMEMLRELNGKAQSSTDKALVHKAIKNVEEQYRFILTQASRAATVSTQNSLAYLNANEREALNSLIGSSTETILREPESEAAAAARRDSLLKKLQELVKENLPSKDQQLIEQARKKIVDAFDQWKRKQQTSSQEAPLELSKKQFEKFNYVLGLEPGQVVLYEIGDIFDVSPRPRDIEDPQQRKTQIMDTRNIENLQLRKAQIMDKLKFYEDKNILPEHKKLIDAVRAKIEQAYDELEKSQMQTQEAMPPMEEGPEAPPLEGAPQANEEIPLAPPLKPEANKAPQTPQVTQPTQRQKSPQPQSGREELLRSIRERGGRGLRPVKERIQPESVAPASGRQQMAPKTGNVPFSQSEEFKQKLRARRQVIEDEPEIAAEEFD